MNLAPPATRSRCALVPGGRVRLRPPARARGQAGALIFRLERRELTMARQWWKRNVESLTKKIRTPRRARRGGGPRLSVERLEDRLAPASTWTAIGPAPI